MNCPSCGKANENDKKACVYCGSTLLPSEMLTNESSQVPPASNSVELTCPLCHKVLSIQKELLGQTVKCPLCNKLFQVKQSPTGVLIGKSQKNPAVVVLVVLGICLFFCFITGLIGVLRLANMTPEEHAKFKKDVQEKNERIEREEAMEKQIDKLKSCAGMDFSDEQVLGSDAIVTYKIISGVGTVDTMAIDIIELAYEVSCEMPEIKTVKVKIVLRPTGLVDKYGNAVKEDIELCTLSYATDPEASKYKNAHYWRTRGGYDEAGLFSANICLNHPEIRRHQECSN